MQGQRNINLCSVFSRFFWTAQTGRIKWCTELQACNFGWWIRECAEGSGRATYKSEGTTSGFTQKGERRKNPERRAAFQTTTRTWDLPNTKPKNWMFIAHITTQCAPYPCYSRRSEILVTTNRQLRGLSPVMTASIPPAALFWNPAQFAAQWIHVF
jgi:hypothetical protein